MLHDLGATEPWTLIHEGFAILQLELGGVWPWCSMHWKVQGNNWRICLEKSNDYRNPIFGSTNLCSSLMHQMSTI